MPKPRFRNFGIRVPLFAAFLLAVVLLATGTWQLAYLAGFVAGILAARARRAVLLGALGVVAAWVAYLAYVFVEGQGMALAGLVGQIFGLGGGAWWLLTLLTLLLGAVLGAVGGWTGFTASRLFLWAEETPAPAEAEVPKS